MNKQIIKIISGLVFGLVITLPFPGKTLAFGISPADISNEYLKPGSHFEREFVVTRPADEANEDLEVFVETELGEIEEWVNYKPGRTFTFPKGEKFVPFTITIDVPTDAQIKNYQGNIKVKARSNAATAAGGVAIVKGAYVEVDLTITNRDHHELKVLQLTMPEVNEGDPVTVLLKIENLGNSPIAPDQVNITISDLNENILENLSDTTFDKIAPHTVSEIKAEFNSAIDVGQYWGDIDVLFSGETIREDKTSFTVKAKPLSVDQPGRGILNKVSMGKPVGVLLFILGLILAAAMIALDLKKQKLTDTDLDKKLTQTLRHNKMLLYGLLGIGALIAIIGLYFMQQNNSNSIENEVKSTSENQLSEKQPEPTPTVTPEPEKVQGVSTVKKQIPEPFVVERDNASGYAIYSTSSLNSEIIYEASENETFSVMQVTGDWYQVVLPDGSIGWLHKASIKSTETVESN